MACRLVFLPQQQGPRLVEERAFSFDWSPGYSVTQKRKNIAALHGEANRHGIDRILEISTKSDQLVGQRLSAFSLKFEIDCIKYPLESVYQGCKVFEKNGPFPHLFKLMPREAKRYIKSHDFGNLVEFNLQEISYPLSPKNAFYDWLYIKSLEEHADWIGENVLYDAFTDIEFNPKKQVNCQARAFAEYLSLLQQNRMKDAVADFHVFSEMLTSI